MRLLMAICGGEIALLPQCAQVSKELLSEALAG